MDQASPPGVEWPRPRAVASRRRWWIGIAAGLIVAAGAGLVLTRLPERPARAAGAPSARPQPVTVAAVRTGDLPVYLTGLGTVTPLNVVTVRSRVDGQLMTVRAREGDLVRTGDLLAEIDPRPFQVQLAQAESQAARDQALLENARADLERYRVLFAQDSVAKQQLDTQASLVQQYEATVKADQAQIDSARLQLTYSRITAPVGGRLGLRLVDPGNIVHASDTTGLIVITQLQPIAVVFSLPEDSLPRVLPKLRAGTRLAVQAYDREQVRKVADGVLRTVDNLIDPTTGTVKLKAEFPNGDGALFPNQFVNARLLLDVMRGATIVPAVAVQRGAQGAFAYVVRAGGTVETRKVELGGSEGDDVAIARGLTPGERVVVEGAERLQEGAPVEVKAEAPPSRPAPPPARTVP